MWKRNERSDLGKISSLRTRIKPFLVKTRSLEIKTRSFYANEANILNKVREKESQENISSKIDPYQIRLNLCLFITASSRFLKCVRQNALKAQSELLWGLNSFFGPKCVFSLIFQIETSHQIKLIWTIDFFINS